MNGSTIAIVAIGAVVVLAGVAVYQAQQAKAQSAQEAVAAYEQGRASGARRSDAERVGGAVATLAGAIWG